MAVRDIKYELEAKLKAVTGRPFSKPSGKLERKSYSDGVERLKISFRNLKVPDASTAKVKVDGVEISAIPISGGTGRYDLESSDLHEFPSLKVGQTVEIHVGNTLFLSGVLCED